MFSSSVLFHRGVSSRRHITMDYLLNQHRNKLQLLNYKLQLNHQQVACILAMAQAELEKQRRAEDAIVFLYCTRRHCTSASLADLILALRPKQVVTPWPSSWLGRHPLVTSAVKGHEKQQQVVVEKVMVRII